MAIEKIQTCIICGCTDDKPCPGGCWWFSPGLCSRCVDEIISEMAMGIANLLVKVINRKSKIGNRK